jgi:cysteinyl-tRNA synthetase
MLDFSFYNSLSRQKETFEPANPDSVTLYACGPTVYDTAHIGNFRTFVLSDMVYRSLLFGGYSIQYVMNVTDVGHLVSDADEGEDKLEKGARREGLTMWELAAKYLKIFLEDSLALNLVPPDILPRATDHIAEQIALIKALEQKGFTYITSDGVYFDTAQFANYGQLSDMQLDQIKEGARVEKNTEKRNSSDFALWKFHSGTGKREMEWESPWGVGFPGWHIECSAMSLKYLGQAFSNGTFVPEQTQTIDIHIGGEDHKMIHHPNEIAQSEGATGKQFVTYWLHGAFLMINDTKISKSLGNYVTIADIQQKGIDPLALRLFFFSSHYRKPLNFTWEALQGSQNALQKLYALMGQLREAPGVVNQSVLSAFRRPLQDDLNVPEAMAVFWEVVKGKMGGADKLATLFKMDEVLGLRLQETWTEYQQIPTEIWDRINERERLRVQKDFAQADIVRNELVSQGYEINDTADGPTVRIITN